MISGFILQDQQCTPHLSVLTVWEIRSRLAYHSGCVARAPDTHVEVHCLFGMSKVTFVHRFSAYFNIVVF